jgi:hypothetical protein
MARVHGGVNPIPVRQGSFVRQVRRRAGDLLNPALSAAGLQSAPNRAL